VDIAAYQAILVFRDTADLALADIAVLVFQDIQEHQAGLASLAGQAIQALAVHQALQVGLVIVVIQAHQVGQVFLVGQATLAHRVGQEFLAILDILELLVLAVIQEFLGIAEFLVTQAFLAIQEYQVYQDIQDQVLVGIADFLVLVAHKVHPLISKELLQLQQIYQQQAIKLMMPILLLPMAISMYGMAQLGLTLVKL